ncbi:SnoaL-like protein [Prauserella shujinwangii]|uniref:SnoaL-like protein n=1 Tax=Prauserella shujinwangii TaxID=1453103 RepID=A0A2T0LLJ1_9PSEU|nr:nuclear transport factor 2 family protein [Prauserella shujinwangii]PRX43858.1 SnoaL-like protein [Prauserella shujinwangii]
MSPIDVPQVHGRPSYASEKQIWRTLCAYCDAIDNGDLDAVARLWEHGTWPFAEAPGPEPARRWFEDHVIRYDGKTHTKHQLSNVVIDVDDDAGTAVFSSYASIWQALPDFPLQPIIYTRFNGTFERVDGRWWWKTAEVLPDLLGDTSRHVRG